MTSPQASQVTEEEFDLAEWIQKNGRKAAWAIGAVVVVLAAIYLWMASNRRKEAFAAADLSRARSTAESGNLPLAANDLARLADRFAGTRAGDEAAVLLSQIRLLQGQLDVAVNGLQEFVARNHDADIQASAYGLLATGLEEQLKFAEAGQAYNRAAALAPMDFLKAGYLLEAARTLATAGDTAAARTAYHTVLTRHGELDQAAEARVRMAEIGGEVPAAPAANNRR